MAPNIKKIWFADNRIYALTEDGRILWQSLLWYKKLNAASDEERLDYEMDDEGIHWYNLDEDVSFESFEYEDREPQGISKIFLTHPELNASAIARRLGISQSILAQYINGIKKPSIQREEMIIAEIRNIGQELSAIGCLCEPTEEEKKKPKPSTKNLVEGYDSSESELE